MYILTKKRNGTLYVGMTKDLASRTARHKTGRGSKFVQKYNIDKLVYYEKVKSYREARSREQQLKWWRRKWKLALIEQMNPEWRDISKEILGPRLKAFWDFRCALIIILEIEVHIPGIRQTFLFGQLDLRTLQIRPAKLKRREEFSKFCYVNLLQTYFGTLAFLSA